MNNEAKKDLMIGMLYALAAHFRYEFSVDQKSIFDSVTETIDQIYYPKKDLTIPTPRGDK